MHFHRDVRQRVEPPQQRVIELRPALALTCAHRHHRPKMPGADAPDVQVEQGVAVGLQCTLDAPADVLVRRHVDQDAAGVAHQPV